MSTPQARALTSEAWNILATAQPGDDRPTLVWAAGAARFGHCLYLWQMWAGHRLADRMSHEGGTIGHGRWYRGDRKGLHITGPSLRAEPLLTIRWHEIEQLAQRAPQHYREQADTNLKLRCHVTGVEDDLYWRRIRGEDVTQLKDQAADDWQRVEACCYDLGALIWKHLRPTVRQLDLLSLLA